MKETRKLESAAIRAHEGSISWSAFNARHGGWISARFPPRSEQVLSADAAAEHRCRRRLGCGFTCPACSADTSHVRILSGNVLSFFAVAFVTKTRALRMLLMVAVYCDQMWQWRP
jgi:hypothetical protein